MSRAYIRGSWGSFIVDAATGVIVEAQLEPVGDDGEGYHDIRRFDPVSIAHAGGDNLDILETGYWLEDGAYVEPLTMRRANFPGYGMDFDDWVPLALLTAA